MEFHKEEQKTFLGLGLNKNKGKIIGLSSVIFYLIIITAFNIYQNIQMNRTVEVVVSKGVITKNSLLLVQNNLAPHTMNYQEYLNYGIIKQGNNYVNRLILWKDVNDKDIGINGKFLGVTKFDHQFITRAEVIDSYVDNSRSLLFAYPGKNIVELDITNSNLKTFKEILHVNDKINLSCSYNAEYNLTLQGANNRSINKEIEPVIITDAFTAISIADILNSDGESLLDYEQFLSTLSIQQQYLIKQTEEYQKKTKVESLLLALTPEEEKLYRYYASKTDVKFNISLPNIDAN